MNMNLSSRRKSLLGYAVSIAMMAGVVPAFSETVNGLSQHTHIHGIAYSQSAGGLLLATHHGIYAVDDRGNTLRVSEIHDYMGFTADPAQPLRFISSGHPAEGGNSGIVESLDGGATWKQMSTGAEGLGPVDFHTMAAGGSGVFYGAFKGIQTSTDGGKTWTLTGNIPEKLIGLLASPSLPGRLYAVTALGLLESADAGKSWKASTFEGEIVSAASFATDGRMVAYVVGRGLVESADNKLTDWATLSSGFGESIPLHIALHPEEQDRMAIATRDGMVLESRDGGHSWAGIGQ